MEGNKESLRNETKAVEKEFRNRMLKLKAIKKRKRLTSRTT